MINSINIENKQQKQIVGNIVNDIYLLPRWEIIGSYSIKKSKFFFFSKQESLNILRKFSSKNMLEKYSIRTLSGETAANMDLRIYKDSVYIVNLDINTNENENEIIGKLLQISVEKAIYNTTDKNVFINITHDQPQRHKIKKILIQSGFEVEENQSKYEIKMFGETFKFSANDCSYWEKSIKQSPVLINK